MTDFVDFGGGPPPWTPLFRAKHEKCPDKLPLFGAVFCQNPGTPPAFGQKGVKIALFCPFWGACFCLNFPAKWPKLAKNDQNRRFWGPKLPFWGSSGPPITCHFFALFNGKMASFCRFFDILTPFFSNKHGQNWPSHPGIFDGPPHPAWGSKNALKWPFRPCFMTARSL